MMRRNNVIILLFLVLLLFTSQHGFSGQPQIESLIPKVVPAGWALGDGPEIFSRETLFEHINGQADLFLQYGFEKSVFVIYRNINASESKIDVDIYDMGNPLQAFGVFSRFRQEDHPAGIGLDSYLDDHYALFYKGRYFVVIQATEANPSILKQFAEAIDLGIFDNSSPPAEIEYFPKRGLKPGSMEYFPDGLLGHQFLGGGFKATYTEQDEKKTSVSNPGEGRDFHLFLSIFENSEQAMNALRLFRDYLSKKEGAEVKDSTQFKSVTLMGTDPYQGKIIVAQKGLHLVGAVGFEQDYVAEDRLAELLKEVK